MLLLLAEVLTPFFSGFNALTYLTLRGILGALTALSTALFLGPSMIRLLARRQIGQTVRDDGPQTHLQKAGTPTMGGALILLAILLSTLLWADLRNLFVWLVIGVILAYGALGFADDYQKLVMKNSKGLSARHKLFWQVLVALLVALILYFRTDTPEATGLLIPYFKNLVIPLGWVFVPFVCVVIVGTSNAVNLTDGLDGLAIMPTVLVGGALGIFAWVTGNAIFAPYLGVPYVAGSGELMVFCAAISGAGLGFLWFNTYPAQVFMGDIGALSLGGALGAVAVVVQQEIALFIMGGVFVAEAVSVIMQVASFKMTGKRIFSMAPLHHHFELKGWAEPKVIVRFWIITVILVLVGLSSLKIR